MNLVRTHTWTLSECKPKAQHEVSDQVNCEYLVNASRRRGMNLVRTHTWALSECKPKAQHEVSDQVNCEYLVNASPKFYYVGSE